MREKCCQTVDTADPGRFRIGENITKLGRVELELDHITRL